MLNSQEIMTVIGNLQLLRDSEVMDLEKNILLPFY